jgi:hypothetical protein
MKRDRKTRKGGGGARSLVNEWKKDGMYAKHSPFIQFVLLLGAFLLQEQERLVEDLFVLGAQLVGGDLWRVATRSSHGRVSISKLREFPNHHGAKCTGRWIFSSSLISFLVLNKKKDFKEGKSIQFTGRWFESDLSQFTADYDHIQHTYDNIFILLTGSSVRFVNRFSARLDLAQASKRFSFWVKECKTRYKVM